MYDLTGRSITPLSDLIDAVDFPLAEFLPSNLADDIFGDLYYTEALSWADGDNLVLDVQLAFESELSLTPPGTDALSFVVGSAGVGWTTLRTEIVLGPDFSMSLLKVPFALHVSPDVLRDVATDAPTEIMITADLRVSPSGFVVENYTGASLAPAYLCGTEIVVEAADVRPVFGLIDPPEFLADQECFQGLAFERMAVRIPSEYLQTDPGADLDIELTNTTIGTTGFTGELTVESADLDHPVSGTLLGFPFRFRSFALNVQQNAIIDAALQVDLRLEVLEEGQNEKWVRVDLAFGGDGSLSGALATVQPPEASDDPAVLVQIDFPDVLRFNVGGLRITRGAQDIWALYLSGTLKIFLAGADDWPEIEFDEIGISSSGEFLLPDGAGIVFASPLVVNWHFVRLTISKFRIGASEQGDGWLQLGLSAEVMLIDGLPAGGSVEGLIVEFRPDGSQPPAVSFKGIGIAFGEPGAFNAEFYAEFTQSPTGVEFRGQGSLALTALDMSIKIGVVVGHETVPQEFSYLYLFADAKLLPTGIPIGPTGLSIYGFQGLLAHNMALDIDQTLPPDERYYALFIRNPIGIAHVNKWEKHFGQNALGFGIVLGTADKGFAVNVKGLLAIALPDLTILLQAKANFIKLKPDLSTASEGTLDALMVYASGQSTISIDIVAYWGIPVLVSVTGQARAFFSFADPTAWYLEIGRDEDGKRVTAQAIEWEGSWLFSAGFWFRLDQNGIVTGVLYELELRAEKGGFWAEVYGMARGEMALFWQPPQWEGSLAMEGRIGAGYKGVSVGIELRGDARARVMRPFDVMISVRACVSALFWDICKRFRFHWERVDPPLLESPLRRWATTPRHWTPREIGTGNELDMGVMTLWPGAMSDGVQPHSIFALDFAKPMVDVTGRFNEAVALDDGGFLTIGGKSGWAGAWRLDAVTLTRDPDGARRAVDIWGTWARETPQPNSTLRLLSSVRFDHDGTLSNGFLDGLDLNYCDEPEDTVYCLSLDEVNPGYGVLKDGSIYHWWNPDKPDMTRALGAKDVCGILLEGGDRLDIDLVAGVESVEVVTCGESPGQADKVKPTFGLERLCERLNRSRIVPLLPTLPILLRGGFIARRAGRFGPLVASGAIAGGSSALLTALLRLCKSWHTSRRSERNDETSGTSPSSAGSTAAREAGEHPCPDEQSFEMKVENGVLVITSQDTGQRYVCTICFRPGHSTPDWMQVSRRGGSTTQHESWTVPADMKLLPPNELYELEVTWTAQLKGPQGAISEPLGTRKTAGRFRTAGPPEYLGALTDYIAGFYPNDGARPVYLGYDLSVTFKDEYVPYLYAAIGERLVIRLFDGQARPVLNNQGEALLVPATTVGPIVQSVTEQYWEEIYQKNIDRGCLAPGVIRHEGETVLGSPASDWSLTPNSQYVAQLVSEDRPNTPLAEWGFTTSRFATFTDLVSTGATILPPRPAANITVQGFDTLARSAGVPTIAFVEHFAVTPLLAADGSSCMALLFESPEPLEFGTRLTVAVEGAATQVSPNEDHTRGIVVPAAGGSWAIGTLAVRLTWLRDANPRLAVDGDASAEIVTFDVELVANP
jgi:hypothetical protein